VKIYMANENNNVDLYALLEISESANEVQIRKAYLRQALRFHPDKKTYNAGTNGTNNQQHLMSDLNKAYNTLVDKQKRKEYDIRRQQNNTYDDNIRVNSGYLKSSGCRVSDIFRVQLNKSLADSSTLFTHSVDDFKIDLTNNNNGEDDPNRKKFEPFAQKKAQLSLSSSLPGKVCTKCSETFASLVEQLEHEQRIDHVELNETKTSNLIQPHDLLDASCFPFKIDIWHSTHWREFIRAKKTRVFSLDTYKEANVIVASLMREKEQLRLNDCKNMYKKWGEKNSNKKEFKFFISCQQFNKRKECVLKLFNLSDLSKMRSKSNINASTSLANSKRMPLGERINLTDIVEDTDTIAKEC
jgi:hypothetical protein